MQAPWGGAEWAGPTLAGGEQFSHRNLRDGHDALGGNIKEVSL
jgi:hypothetical protein